MVKLFASREMAKLKMGSGNQVWEPREGYAETSCMVETKLPYTPTPHLPTGRLAIEQTYKSLLLDPLLEEQRDDFQTIAVGSSRDCG